MFNFQTTTFINSTKYAFDETLDRFSATASLLKINKNDIRIKKANVVGTEFFKKEGCVGVADSVKITLPTAAEAATAGYDLYRLVLRVQLSMVDQDSYYANDLVFKGKPFYVEFKAGSTAAQVAEIIKKYELMMVEKPLFDISGTGQDLTIKGKTGSQRIKQCYLQAWDSEATNAFSGAIGGFVDTDIKGTVTLGHEEFGTYHQLMKDNHLPTYENLRWNANQADETPIPGSLYNQYIIRECVDRGIMGGAAVGQTATSITTHVFWVLSGATSTAFETAIKTTLGLTEVDVDKHAAQSTTTLTDGTTAPKVNRANDTTHDTATA